MNSRSDSDENLVNFPSDLSNTNQSPQKRKEPLLSFPFDHLYACHSESSHRRHVIELDKELEIATHCIVTEEKSSAESPNPEIAKLTGQLSVAETLNRKLKDLLVYHLDLVQQQNDALTKKDKLYQALQIENESLKSKLNNNTDTNTPPVVAKQPINPQSLLNINTSSPSVSSIIKAQLQNPPQIMFDSLSELLIPERSSPIIYNSDDTRGLENYLQSDLDLQSMSSILDPTLNCDSFTMIVSKSPLTKEPKPEPRSEPLYTVTTNSGNPIIQRSRRRTSSGLGSLSRMPKKGDIPETSQIIRDDKKVERIFGLNKKAKMINTSYGKSRATSSINRPLYLTGSLSDRLRLIDTTPTGEDPYQLREADMREHSPIPKLMHPKNNNRSRTWTSTSTSSTITTRRIYDPAVLEPDVMDIEKLEFHDNKYNLPNVYMHSSEIKSQPPLQLLDEPELEVVKTDSQFQWPIYTSNRPLNQSPSMCDFSYGENANNLATNLLTEFDTIDFPDLFTSDSTLNLDNISPVDFSETTTVETMKPVEKVKKRTARTTKLVAPIPYLQAEKTNENVKKRTARTISLVAPIPYLQTEKTNEKVKKRTARTISLAAPIPYEEPLLHKRVLECKGSRKRTLSASELLKAGLKGETTLKKTAPKPKTPRGKVAAYVKKPPVPGMTTTEPYYTLMGDPDLSWYLGLDPAIKPEDVDLPGTVKTPTVEVPRWRVKPYTGCYSSEGTEDLSDKVFEKRHLKYEAHERRQLRWHMRMIREEKNLERLRKRQKDPWSDEKTQTPLAPSSYTIWPQPQKDIEVIEITDTLPVMAFGESVPDLPTVGIMLPWVRKSKPLKRSSNRSHTLH